MKIISRVLFHEHHLSGLGEGAGREAVQVHTTRQAGCVEADVVGPGRLTGVYERGDVLAGDVVHLELHVGGFRQCIADACTRVEGVRVVLGQVEGLRELACCTVDSVAVITVRSIVS